MRVAIHQPHYMPWLGYLRKMREADVFVYFDTADYIRHGFINRNRILVGDKEHWLTVPVLTRGKYANQAIKDVKVNWDIGWNTKHYRTLLYNYATKKEDKKEALEAFFLHDDELLIDWCVRSIDLLCDAFGIKTEKVLASSLGVNGIHTERLVSICKKLGASFYLTGFEHKDYIDEKAFGDIKFEYIDWKPKSHLSALHFYLKGDTGALEACE